MGKIGEMGKSISNESFKSHNLVGSNAPRLVSFICLDKIQVYLNLF